MEGKGMKVNVNKTKDWWRKLQGSAAYWKMAMWCLW